MQKMMNRRLITYILVSFGFSWAVALGIHLGGGFSKLGNLAIIPAYAYMCGPMVGALLCVFLFEKGRRVKALGISGPINRYLPLAWFIGLAVIIAAWGVSLAAPDVTLANPIETNIKLIEAAAIDETQKQVALKQLEYPAMIWILLGSALFLGPVINTPLMLSEELGWRGYLWDQLRPLGFWKLSWITGFLWGVWHIPIILLGHNYPAMPVLGGFIFTGLCLLMGPIYSWVRLKSGSVWGPCILHGTTNAAAGFFLLAQSSMDMPWKGLLGIGGFIALSLAVFLIWRFNRKTSLTIPA